MRPPLAQYWMWCRSTRRDSQPGNRHRQPSRSRAARRMAALGRRRRRPRASTMPPSAVSHPGQRGGAAEHLRGGDADRRAVLDVAPGRVRRITRDPRRRRRFRGNAGAAAGPGAGQDIRAGVHHDLVHLRVIRPGHLAGQERLRDGDQAISQVRRGPDGRARPRPAASAAGGSAAAGVSAETSPPGSPAWPARSAQAARSALSSTAPASGGSRNVPDREPSSSNRQASRRRTRASASSAVVTWRCARANRSS